MKGLTKFFSAAIAAASLASCSSDDLNFGTSGKFDQTKLVGTIENGTTRTGMVDSKDDSYPIVWSADDKVNVYSLQQNLLYDEYTLQSGAGSAEGNFQSTTTNVDITVDHPIAVTSSNLVYGLSARGDKARLTTKIPTNFDWSEENAVDFADKKYYKNDAPYWGDVTVKGGQMAVSFKKLTGAIKIDAALLPQGTKAVVIASAKVDQPLSGTFNTTLEGNNVLAKDPELVNSNQIRVNFPVMGPQNPAVQGDHQRVFIVPLVCGTYDNLKFIAIVNDESDAAFISTGNPADIIPNDGTDVAKKIDRGTPDQDYFLLRSVDNVTVTTETVLSIYPAVAMNLDNMTPMQISEEVIKAYDDKHDFIFNITNIKMDNSYVPADGDNTIYIPNNVINNYRKASITFNFADDKLNQDAEHKLYFKEAEYKNPATTPWTAANNGLHFNTAQATTINSPSAAYARKININLQDGDGTKVPVDVYLPTSRVTLGNSAAAKYSETVTVIAENSNDISNTGKDAGLNIEGSFAKVVVDDNHTGGAIVKGDFVVDELEITNPTAGLVKVDDASVATINYSAIQSVNTYVYTVGSAAIKQLTDDSNKVRVRAFWTGKALTDNQILDLYDQATIYTAAQLASLGKNAAEVPVYTISGKVSQMQLGGSTYPWVGATIDYAAESFTLDCNGVGLRSMVLDPAVANTDNLGLIKSITTVDQPVVIENIDLYQAVLKENGKDNIGAVVGKIEAGNGNVEFGGTQNSVREIDLTTTGSNVGGIFGKVVTTGNVNSTATNVNLSVTKLSGQDNVGGFGGSVEAADVVPQKTINLTATGNITGSGNNVGGMFGYVKATGDYKTNAKVTIDAKDITAAGINAGGIVGYYSAASGMIGSANHANSVSVKATKVAADFNAGGLVGNADKGNLTIGRDMPAYGSPVTVDVTNLTGGYHVGGLVGLCNVNAGIYGQKVDDETYPVTVKIGSFTNPKAAADFNTTELKLACGTFGGMIGKANVTVTIATNADNAAYNVVENAATLLSDANKAALNFMVNVAEEKDAYGNTQYYWGDTNYNVGYVVEGYDYKIGGSKQTVNTDYNTFKAY